MPILTSGYVDRAIGTSTRVGIVGSPTTSGSAFAQFEAQARGVVASRLALKGYSIGTTSTNDTVRFLVLGQWYYFAGSLRKGLEPPPLIREAIDMLAATTRDENAIPIAGLTQDTEDGVGGAKFSVTTESATNGRVQYFSRDKMRQWG